MAMRYDAPRVRSGRLCSARVLAFVRRGATTFSFVAALACGGDESPVAPGIDAGPPPEQGTRFILRIENASFEGPLRTALTPGVWATHSGASPMFDLAAGTGAEGFETFAEAGRVLALADSVAAVPTVARSGVFRIRAGAKPEDVGGGSIAPSQAFDVQFLADEGAPRLSFATRIATSNDVVVSSPATGIALFDDRGQPLSGRDVTADVILVEAGTEADEPPASGASQVVEPLLGDEIGGREGVVRRYTHATRALPLASKCIRATVTEAGGALTFSFENVSTAEGAITTLMAPVFYATHVPTWRLFEDGAVDFGMGLELLAEDGSPRALVTSYTGAVELGQVAGTAAPYAPTERAEFTITPDRRFPRLTIATMIVESNDAFIAMPPAGLALFEDDALVTPRRAEALADELNRRLIVWDAGTEANEVPGVGPTQPLRMMSAGSTTTQAVRRYVDRTNDLSGPMAGGFVDVSVTNSTISPGQMELVVRNTSGGAFPGRLSGVVWALHDGSQDILRPGMPASDALASMMRTEDPTGLVQALASSPAVSTATSGPTLATGVAYRRLITPTAGQRYLAIVAKILPSNDAFVAFDGDGVALLNRDGTPRTDAEITADVRERLYAWDAGIEETQAGAAGPHQNAMDGPPEGNGQVRIATNPVFPYPHVSTLVRVTIRPASEGAVPR